MSFAGMRVLSLESRRTAEMAQLIRNQQGEPFVAPSLREAPIEHNEQAFQFAERLFRGEFDMMILLTGVGTRALAKLLATRHPPERFPEALRVHHRRHPAQQCDEQPAHEPTSRVGGPAPHCRVPLPEQQDFTGIPNERVIPDLSG